MGLNEERNHPRVCVCNIHTLIRRRQVLAGYERYRCHIYSALSTQHLNFKLSDSIPLYLHALCRTLRVE